MPPGSENPGFDGSENGDDYNDGVINDEPINGAILEVNDEDDDVKIDKNFYKNSLMMSSKQIEDIMLRSNQKVVQP